MIELNRLNGKSFILNCDLIQTIEETPDTVITLTTGEKYMVTNPVDEVVHKSIRYQKQKFEREEGK